MSQIRKLAGFLQELRRRKVIRVLIAYLVAAWLLLQVAEVLSSILSLPEWAPKLVLYLLVIGLVPALIFSWAYDLTPDGIRRDADVPKAVNQSSPGQLRAGIIVVGVILAAGLGAGAIWLTGSGERWARNVAIPQIERHIAADEWEQAYAVAMSVMERLPDSPLLDGIWSEFSVKTSIPSEPRGATVYRRAYDDSDAPWKRLGDTPLFEARIPRGFSLMRFEMDGFHDVLRIVGAIPLAGGEVNMASDEHATGIQYVIPPVKVVLDPSGPVERPEVHVPGTRFLLDGELIRLADFRIGQYEVTNRAYQVFVDAGGYERQDYWEHEFVRDGETIPWDEAMVAFKDSTGRPGPSTWIGGAFPEGQDDYPVGGISWYEAAAYARFAGRELPTVHHWRRAHAPAAVTWQVLASNLESDAVAPVGQFAGISWTGTSDMLGNVREWCANALGDQRAILGGAWTDLAYAAPGTVSIPAALPPFDRSPQNGVRLASVRDERDVRVVLQQPVLPRKPTETIQPASSEEFAAILRNFDYGSGPLNVSIDETVEIRNGTRQQISFDRGDGERVGLFLYLPDSGAGRHRLVLYWPSSLALMLSSIDDYRMPLDFMLRNGWAVAVPVFERTFYRIDAQSTVDGEMARRDLTIRRVREMRRTIDYLETRPDIATESLTLFGLSWGGSLGPLALVAEPRLKAAILNQAGIYSSGHYDVRAEHYLPRVRQPVLQFNGRFDTNFRYEDRAKPFFDLLGSESKRHVVEPTGHFAPNSVIIGETLAWLDEHLSGPN
jgi:formylglycine-generating enzyme required for sulfatase activity